MHKLFYKIHTKIFARRFFYKFNVILFRMAMRGMGIGNYETRGTTGEDNFINFLKKNELLTCVFDVGANVGKYSKNCASNGAKEIHCFEPMPQNFKQLTSTLKDTTANIKLNQLGVSDKTGEFVFYDKSEDGSSHATMYKGTIDAKCSETVECTTLDLYCEANNIKHIDLLKVDVEGNEYKVLKGASKLIKNKQIDVVQFEFNYHNITSRNFYTDFEEILQGYKLYRLLPKSFLPLNSKDTFLNEIFYFQNIVAIRSNLELKHKV